MINIEGKSTITILGYLGDLTVTAGPGDILQMDSASFQADNYTVISKPDNSVSFATITKGYYLEGTFIAKGLNNMGEPESNEIMAKVKFPKFRIPFLGTTRISVTPHYLFTDPALPTLEANGAWGELGISILPSSKTEMSLIVGARSEAPDNSGFINLNASINDIFNTGTYIDFSAYKVGENYRSIGLDKLGFGLINYVDKYILDGTSDLGIKISQNINRKLKFYLIADMVMDKDSQFGEDYEGTSLTLAQGFEFDVAPGILMNLLYKTYQVPSKVADATDADLKRIVSKVANIYAINIVYSF